MDVPTDARNISSDKEARRDFYAKGYEFVPVVEIGDTVITDYTGHPQLIEALHKEGYLVE
jgi:hypothetical protein